MKIGKIFAVAAYFVFGVSMLCSLSACAGKANQDENTKEKETASVEVVESTVAEEGGVIVLEDESTIAPGKQVSQLTIIDFNAVWCGPCRQLAPVFDEMAKKYAGRATFISVDIDNHPELFLSYNVGTAIPAVVFIKPDGTREHYIGTGELLPAENLEALIEKNLK